jgi:uncharacterized membrane protein (DUF373 family)
MPAQESSPAQWTVNATVWMEHAQDVVSSAVGLVLVLLAAVILVDGVVNFVRDLSHLSLSSAATNLLDEALLVLILVEIVHTVVLSLRAHALAARPFIVVGLVAVIRKILLALGSQQPVSVTVLAIYIGMTVVFVASMVAVQVLDARGMTGTRAELVESGTADQ